MGAGTWVCDATKGGDRSLGLEAPPLTTSLPVPQDPEDKAVPKDPTSEGPRKRRGIGHGERRGFRREGRAGTRNDGHAREGAWLLNPGPAPLQVMWTAAPEDPEVMHVTEA